MKGGRFIFVVRADGRNECRLDVDADDYRRIRRRHRRIAVKRWFGSINWRAMCYIWAKHAKPILVSANRILAADLFSYVCSFCSLIVWDSRYCDRQSTTIFEKATGVNIFLHVFHPITLEDYV